MRKPSLKVIITTGVLILANAVPVLGVLLFSWDSRSMFTVYWLETYIICLFSILKLLKTCLLSKRVAESP